MDIVLKIMEVIIPIAMGVGCRLGGLFGDEESEILRRFVIRISVPLLVFFSMLEAKQGEMSYLPKMMLAFVLVSVILFLVGWLCSYVESDGARRAAIHACCTFGNYGWMGFGVCQVLLGDIGFRRAVFFIILWWPVFFLLGLPIGLIHSKGKKRGIPIGRALKVAVPVLSMMALGLFLKMRYGLSPDDLPALIQNTLQPFGNMTVPLILFSVGTMLDFSTMHRSLPQALLVSGVSLLAGALIGVGVGMMLGTKGVTYDVIVLEAAMPVATLTPVLAENYELDLELTGTCIVVSTVVSLVTVPIVAAMLTG
jgi:hypothetical protein